MTRRLKHHPTGWWKAEAYELRDGYLCPAKKTRFMPYDPMEIYEVVRTQKKGHLLAPERPYVSLARTLQSLRWKMGAGGREFAERTDKLLLAWVNEHGLLGILHQQTLQLIGDFYRLEQGPDDPEVHTKVAWDQRGEPELALSPPHVKYRCRRLTAVVRPLPGGTIRFQPWTEFAQRFFPGFDLAKGPAYGYPSPGEPRFWSAYCEPLDDFLDSAQLLVDAMVAIANLRDVSAAADSDPDSGFEARSHLKGELDPLNSLLQTVTPRLLPDPEHCTPMPGWHAPSLLALLAFQLHRDLAEGIELEKEEPVIRRCTICKVPFVSMATRAFYCSTECREEAVRRSRRKGSRP